VRVSSLADRSFRLVHHPRTHRRRARSHRPGAVGHGCGGVAATSRISTGSRRRSRGSDGVIHVAHRQDLLAYGGMDAVAAAELPIMLAYGEALAGTGKSLVAAGSIGSPGQLGRPVTEEDPALTSAMSTRALSGFAMSWKLP
jgi:hypothetical protein